MPAVRVLVVDDSAIIRKIVSEELAANEIEVVGTAPNGRFAVAKVAQLRPDLVLLDVEMPEMDGLEALAAIRKEQPRLPVIMFSALTERGATATLDALSLGATDYFTKPGGPGGIDESRRVIREQLVPAIKELVPSRRSPEPRTVASSPFAPTEKPHRVDVIAIGVSTGGPNALHEVFRTLPGDLPVPIVLVQHMPPMFTKLLADRLTAAGKVPVEEATSGKFLEPGRALIAPGDFHMTVARDGVRVRALLNQNDPECSCRPAVDPLFRSVAKVYGEHVLAVIMTGMGQDGLKGCQVIRSAGGRVVVQDESTSVVWGMPGSVAKAGLADRVLPLSMLSGEIVRRVRSGGTRT